MKRVTGILIILAALLHQAAARDTNLTPERISGKGFSTGMGSASVISQEGDFHMKGGMFVRFMKNGNFHAEIAPGQGDIEDSKHIKGRYEIKSGKLTLYSEGSPWLKNGILKYDVNNLKYPYSLRFESNINSVISKVRGFGSSGYDNMLYDIENKAREDIKVKIKGVDALTMGYTTGFTRAPLNVRTAPSVKAAKLVFKNESGKKTSVLKNGTDLNVLARTPRRDKVGNWEHFWYYIEFEEDNPDGIFHKAWVFGEFIKLSEQ